MSQQQSSDGQRDPIEEVARLLNSASAPTGSIVLLDGSPLSGVTRTMYEAVKRYLPEAPLLPVTAVALAKFCAQPDFATRLAGAVLWLDDLSPADLVLLGQGLLDLVLPHVTLVLSSVNTDWRTRLLTDTSAVTAPARTVLLEFAQRVTVPFAMTPRERTWLREMGYPVSKGIAESLVGGEVLVRHYRKAARSNPQGHLLVQAAVDARRCGIHRPLTEHELFHLWCTKGGSDWGLFQSGLAWAGTAPEGASTGLLFRAAGGQSRDWRVLSYAAGADNGDHGYKARPLDDQGWQGALEGLPEASDLYSLGVAAHLHGRADIARAAFTEAATDHQLPAGAAAVAALKAAAADGTP